MLLQRVPAFGDPLENGYTGVSHPAWGVYPTLRHMDGVVKQLELLVYGERIAANVDAQAELFRMLE